MSVFFNNKKPTHTSWQTTMILDTRFNFFLICVFSNEEQRVLYVTFKEIGRWLTENFTDLFLLDYAKETDCFLINIRLVAVDINMFCV